MTILRDKKAKHFAALLVVGAGLLVTLSACENSKRAEIMSKEDLLAQAPLATIPDTDTQTERQAQSDQSDQNDQTGGSFEGQSVDEESLGLSKPLVIAPESPPSPASPPSGEGMVESGPEGVPPAAVLVPARAPVLPAGYAESPLVRRSPASDYVPDSPPQVFHAARVREFGVSAGPVAEPEAAPVREEPVPATEPAAEPEMEIAKLEPSDFVPEAPEPEPEGRQVEAVVDSELADVFFGFDQYAVHAGAVPVLERNAELLKQAYKNSGVVIEGHCDERGTGKYNLELGKRRAQAVKEYLVDLGVEASRIQIASYGKEKPFCTESTPSCWQQNRRGHFVQRVLLSSSSQGE